MRILTVEDDALLAEAMADVLAQQHYAVDVAADGKTGWQLAIATTYDLILLDIMLPQLDGISLCRQLRQAEYQGPILLLTVKDSCTDKVAGLDAGADDYVVKPIDLNELMARIRALLRRGAMASSPVLTWNALSLDPGSLAVTYDHQPLHLTATEHRLLELFLRHPQRVFSRSAIVEHLWTFDDQPEAATVKTYVKNLRQKLKRIGAPADLIETVYGLGYRLKPSLEQADTTEPAAPSTERCLQAQQALLAVAQARAQFKPQIRDRLSHLQQALKALAPGMLSSELHQQAVYEAHRFAGTLGTFGFMAASQQAAAIEDLLQNQPLNGAQVQQIRQRLSQLSQDLEPVSIQTVAIPEPSVSPKLRVVSQDKDWVDELLQRANDRSIALQSIALPSISLTPNPNWVDLILQRLQVDLPDLVLLDLDAAPIAQIKSLLIELGKRFAMPTVVMMQRDHFQDRLELSRCGVQRVLLKTTPDRILDQVLQTWQAMQTRAARILVVDDDRQTCEAIQATLEPKGLQLKLLFDPQQFWSALGTFSPDLLILAVEMLDLSGIDLCRMVRTDPVWRLPILCLTAANHPATVNQLYSIGADDCLAKPIVAAQLLTRVLNRLAREQSRLIEEPLIFF